MRPRSLDLPLPVARRELTLSQDGGAFPLVLSRLSAGGATGSGRPTGRGTAPTYFFAGRGAF